ncbi:MAG TPA: protein-methionine-sulfoxide reductase catalytic subunit MsrP [Acidobacteriota bacterium]|nr:protein-methionine-sulfoxide reductase catalytic subunit MsrP [Acidobacteriota bacterium]
MANVHIKPSWNWIRESEATSESTYLNRRSMLRHMGLGSVGLAGSALSLGFLSSVEAAEGDLPEAWVRKWADLFPAVRNEAFKIEGGITDESVITSFNNFYEFSLIKERVKNLVGRFETHPWEIQVSGEVERKGKFDLDKLVRIGEAEERLYHFRCVEAWSANVPWTGFPFSKIIEKLGPKDSARYVRLVTVLRPEQLPGQKDTRYPWPYYEALTMEEALNELTLFTFGVYGHPLNKQNGAPARLVLPWKYGFKSIKSIVKIEFVRRRPGTFWGDISSEYGFYANVNPAFDHPRWSQATEIFLNTGSKIPTRIYNGYGKYVAHLYNPEDRKYFF